MVSSTSSEIEPNASGSRAAMVAGLSIAILGFLAVVFPFVTGLSVAILLGAILIIGALVHVSHAFSAGNFRTVLGQVILAVLYVFSGIAFIANPVVGLATLTLLAIGFFLLDGLIEIAWGLQSRGQPGAMWLLVSGGISLLLAGFLWLGFPTSAIWAIGVLLGVNLFVTGVSIVLLGRETRESIAQDIAQGSQG
ncbi:HdeD family acid-resistance protein [Salinibaculum salinum]|uniref:HdeD family acid-resistance protein n=1 Tax=Salinibaculum salinum TaxID=3131996 RepID=UPI0030EEB0C7